MHKVAFNIFGINIYCYSICILLGVIVAYFLIVLESKKHKINKDDITDLIFYTVIFGLLGARLYYVIFNIDYYINNPLEIIAVWNGGLAIHGGLIAGIIFIYFYTKKKNINFLRMLDICAPAVMLAQGIGRWGNFFNKEAHGGPIKLETLQNMHIPKFIIDGMKIDGIYYYPTFFFECLGCILGFLLIIIIRKYKNPKLGFITAIYLIWYGIIRFFIESLRTDSLMLFNFKMAQIISILSIIIGIVLIFVIKQKDNYIKEE